MLGIDLTRVSRFKNASDSFLKKVLHTSEIEEYDNSNDKPLFLAKRWAIKEALFKADNSLVNFNKIQITKKNDKYNYDDFYISTSREDEYVVAIARKGNNE